MLYAKLIDGMPSWAPRIVIYNGRRIANPRPAILLDLGYKPVQFTDPPEVPAGYHLEESWTENGEKIVQVWSLVPDPEPDPEEV